MGEGGTYGVHQKVVIEHRAKFQLCPIFFQQMAILELILLDYSSRNTKRNAVLVMNRPMIRRSYVFSKMNRFPPDATFENNNFTFIAKNKKY